jgi:RNA-directed DNA polymerase
MSASKYFSQYFTKKKLLEIYDDDIQYKSARGVDRISNRIFKERVEENIDIIYRKAHNGSYQFSQYREKLLLRGAKRNPRVISIPTIRDKITQKAITKILDLLFRAQTPFLHGIINEVITTYRSGLYQNVLRLDVKNFYPSIQHDFLMDKVGKKIRKKELLHLIRNAISQRTVAIPNKKDKGKNDIGVPQGLSISNILANIYLLEMDDKYSRVSTIRYFRYVDDILIFCQQNDVDRIGTEITDDCLKLGLELHPMGNPLKSSVTDITDGFTYLGYDFTSSNITVRKKTVDRFRESLIKILTNYKYSETKDLEFLKWAINLRITGCVFNESKYGWVFFFSQIDDLSLLGKLDYFVKKQMKRFDITEFKPKTFLRTYHETTKNLSNTTYIPNFDGLSVAEKHKMLVDIFKYEHPLMTQQEIEYQFRRRIYKTVKELERDISRDS